MRTAPPSMQRGPSRAATKRAVSPFLPLPGPPASLAGIAILVACLAACTGAPVLPDLDAPATLAVADTLRDNPLVVTRANTLDERQREVLDQCEALAWSATAWDPATLGALEPFARVVVAQDPRIGREQHPGERWFIIAEGPWTDAHADAVISRLFRVPGTPGALVHFDTDEPLPFALEYRFANTWHGQLESQLYGSLSQSADTPGPNAFIERSRAALSAFGLTLDDPRVEVVDELDRLLRALPRPQDGVARTADVPQATLLAIGLLLGEQLVAQVRGTEWLAGDTAEAKFYGVAVSGLPNTVVRPIDFVEMAWRSDVQAPLRAYLDLVAARIAHARSED